MNDFPRNEPKDARRVFDLKALAELDYPPNSASIQLAPIKGRRK